VASGEEQISEGEALSKRQEAVLQALERMTREHTVHTFFPQV
jgi:hypothetical protein